MSDDPADWMRQIAENIRADRELPPGVIAMESDIERVARWVSHPGGPATAELMEDLCSFGESFPYFIRVSERGEPVPCECCGTLVALIPEAKGTGSSWKPGIWEHETFRRHTARRCEWKRAN